MKKKAQGVGSILRKREEKEECSLLWKNNLKLGEPTHKIKKIKIENDIVTGYIEVTDKSTVRVPIKKLEAPLFFGVGNEDYVADGMEEDMLRAEKASKEIRKQIEDAIAKVRGEATSETDNSVPVFLNKDRENHLKNLRKKANMILVENAFIKRVNNLSALMSNEGFTPEVYLEEKDKIVKLMDRLSPEFIKNNEEVIKQVKTMFENTDKSLKEYKGE
nr:MAG TPA: hypothetical protein [Caudoviricetes sp.]